MFSLFGDRGRGGGVVGTPKPDKLGQTPAT